jgi:hypothetical protein
MKTRFFTLTGDWCSFINPVETEDYGNELLKNSVAGTPFRCCLKGKGKHGKQ